MSPVINDSECVLRYVIDVVTIIFHLLKRTRHHDCFNELSKVPVTKLSHAELLNKVLRLQCTLRAWYKKRSDNQLTSTSASAHAMLHFHYCMYQPVMVFRSTAPKLIKEKQLEVSTSCSLREAGIVCMSDVESADCCKYYSE